MNTDAAPPSSPVQAELPAHWPVLETGVEDVYAGDNWNIIFARGRNAGIRACEAAMLAAPPAGMKLTDEQIVKAIERHVGWFKVGDWFEETKKLPHVEMEYDVMTVEQAIRVARAIEQALSLEGVREEKK